MGRYRFGQIVAVPVDDSDGETKRRPAVIISSDRDCDTAYKIIVIPISTSIRYPIPYYHIWVHRDNSRDHFTGLFEPCVAKVNWRRLINPQIIRGCLGDLPDVELDLILDVHEQLMNDSTFNDWV